MPELKKAIFVVRTLEPDKQSSSKKQISKEFLKYSDTILSEDTMIHQIQERQLQNQIRNDKKKLKKKEYKKKKDAKLKQKSADTPFDS